MLRGSHGSSLGLRRRRPHRLDDRSGLVHRHHVDGATRPPQGAAAVAGGGQAEAIHADFITEVSKRLVDAISRPAERLEMMVGLEAAIGRMRLSSSREVIVAAEKLIKLVAETCASPNLSFEEVLAPARRGVADPLAEFGEACRAGLRALRG